VFFFFFFLQLTVFQKAKDGEVDNYMRT